MVMAHDGSVQIAAKECGRSNDFLFYLFNIYIKIYVLETGKRQKKKHWKMA